jgi:superfamily I DNA/RNA helicase
MYPGTFDPDCKSPAEEKLYDLFKHNLSNEWVVLHNVKWVGKDAQGRPCDGQTDFIIGHAKIGILVVEAKGGLIAYNEGVYTSKDRNGEVHFIKDPFEQATAAKHNLIARLQATKGWPNSRVLFGHAAALPDSVIESEWFRPNAPKKIIIDFTDLQSIETCLKRVFSFWKGEKGGGSPPGERPLELMIRTFALSTEIRNPLLAEKAREDAENISILTERQFRYLRFLSGQRRAAISGCAGAGKTFLAVEKARQLASNGMRVLFTCFNRPLADHIGLELKYNLQFDVFSFHQVCVHWTRKSGQSLPGRESDPNYFIDTLPNGLLRAIDTLGSQYDAIIVDEAQDFRIEWMEVLPHLLHDPDNGIFYVFYDNNQQLYRDRSSISGESESYQLDENCRNTQSVFNVVKHFYKGTVEIRAIGPDGVPIEVLWYKSRDEGLKLLRNELHKLFEEARFTRNEVAILTPLGANTSNLFGLRLGNYTLSEQLPLSPGEVFVTTVRKFKGLERPVIVLAEIDSRMDTGQIEEIMYVGTSRAKTHLILLVSESIGEAVKSALKAI